VARRFYAGPERLTKEATPFFAACLRYSLTLLYNVSSQEEEVEVKEKVTGPIPVNGSRDLKIF
jgi:hypothetical protein